MQILYGIVNCIHCGCPKPLKGFCKSCCFLPNDTCSHKSGQSLPGVCLEMGHLLRNLSKGEFGGHTQFPYTRKTLNKLCHLYRPTSLKHIDIATKSNHRGLPNPNPPAKNVTQSIVSVVHGADLNLFEHG